jgi:hypothetical protein
MFSAKAIILISIKAYLPLLPSSTPIYFYSQTYRKTTTTEEASHGLSIPTPQKTSSGVITKKTG